MANEMAKVFKQLHIPDKPLVLANVYDYPSAQAVAALPSTRALATASFGIARAAGTKDEDLTLDTNLQAVRLISKAAKEFQKPLSVDIQDAYGSRLEEAIHGLIECGVVGVNLEDCDKDMQQMYNPEDAVERVKRVIAVATAAGVPDFVVNARCDALLHGGDLDEAIQRGKKYLDAGATTVFVFPGGKRPLSNNEIERLVKEFDGRLSFGASMSATSTLTVSDLAKLGVARISVGPQLQSIALEVITRRADEWQKNATW